MIKEVEFQIHDAPGEKRGLSGRGRNVFPVMGDLST